MEFAPRRGRGQGIHKKWLCLHSVPLGARGQAQRQGPGHTAGWGAARCRCCPQHSSPMVLTAGPVRHHLVDLGVIPAWTQRGRLEHWAYSRKAPSQGEQVAGHSGGHSLQVSLPERQHHRAEEPGRASSGTAAPWWRRMHSMI